MSHYSEKIRLDRCCNPFGKSGHKGKDLRRVSKAFLSKYPDVSEKALLCTNCRKESYVSSSNISIDEETSRQRDVDEPQPVKKMCLSREDKLEKLMDGLKEKFFSLPENDPLRVSILTILPDCWTLREIIEEFNVSMRIAKKARDLRHESGILATPDPKKGKTLPDSTVSKVLKYYDSDTNSRVMPNKKDVLKIKENGKIITVPKRLLLFDVKILFRNFKEEHPRELISFSKFAELRPSWCVLAGERGTHSVCVCVIHQNFKAMFDASNLIKLTQESHYPLQGFTDCIKFVLCRNPEPDCYLGRCKKCPKLSDFQEFVESLLIENDIEDIIYSIWVSTDKCTLKKECLNIHDFVQELSQSLEKLIPHHFISKKQSQFISDLKNNLKSNEGLLEMDYSENYKYVVQNAAQQFHYNNDQCSIHVVILYYKEEQELKHCSFVLLSDCTTHDTTAVYLSQTYVIPAIVTKFPRLTKLFYASDGAVQHFKNRYQMVNMVNHEEDFSIKAEWHYNATAHGKSSCDGVGSVLKSQATRASLQDKGNEAILNSTELYNWAKNKFPNITFFHYTQQDYDRVSRKLSKRFKTAPKVMKISKAHAFKVSNNKFQKTLTAFRYSESTEILSTTEY